MGVRNTRAELHPIPRLQLLPRLGQGLPQPRIGRIAADQGCLDPGIPLPPSELGRDHFGIVDQHRVAGPQIIGQIGDAAMFDAPIAMHHHQPGAVARHGGAQRVVIEVDDPARLEPPLREAPWATAVNRDGDDLVVEVADLEVAYREVPVLVVGLDLRLRRFEAAEASLEDVFVDLVEGQRP